MAKTDFLTLNSLSPPALFKVLERAHALKNSYHAREFSQTLKQHVLAMIFEKSSTRTRVSFEAGMTQLGGSAIFLSPTDTQLGRGEPLEDTARVLSEMVSAVMIRTDDHNKLERFAEAATIPVINGLSDSCHPCQLLADVQTMQERFGDVRNLRVAWIGDGNNVCHSYLEAANIFEFNLTVAVPSSYKPAPEWVEKANGRVTFVDSPEDAVKGAQVVTTDVWTSMGQENEIQDRLRAFNGYQITPALLDSAAKDVCFLHCLPAHKGEEISDNLFADSRTNSVWSQAGNRLHAQKALLEHLING
ncbi:MAG: ornithine carbamoyltransferase [Gammaproteobacteria bacterium]|nr:ornithine carbamoyltransferase [Gammaproteobacteria bacterium]